MKPRKGGIVYSTELGRTCPVCRRSLNLCECSSNTTRVLGDGNVKVGYESKGRGGKVVTTVSGVPMTAGDLATLAGQLKKRCGSGGTIKDGVIEIQGDHREAIMTQLISLGMRPKRSGG